MNYLKIYQQLCESRQTERQLAEYSELHHIIPVCLGGREDATNLVRLTSREHFLAHWLLSKIYPENRSVQYSLVAQQMNRYGNRVLAPWQKRICSKKIGELGKQKIKAGFKPKLGKPVQMEACSRISETLVQYFNEHGNPVQTVRTKEYLSEINTGSNNPSYDSVLYSFFNPVLGKIMVMSQYDFYTQMGLNQAAINGVCLHKNTSHHGWYLSACPNPSYKVESKRDFIHKFENLQTGENFVGTAKSFYKSYKFHDGSVSSLILGKKKYLRGWKYCGVIDRVTKGLTLKHYSMNKANSKFELLPAILSNTEERG